MMNYPLEYLKTPYDNRAFFFGSHLEPMAPSYTDLSEKVSRRVIRVIPNILEGCAHKHHHNIRKYVLPLEISTRMPLDAEKVFGEILGHWGITLKHEALDENRSIKISIGGSESDESDGEDYSSEDETSPIAGMGKVTLEWAKENPHLCPMPPLDPIEAAPNTIQVMFDTRETSGDAYLQFTLNNEEFVATTSEIPVHKGVLAAAFPYFDRKFRKASTLEHLIKDKPTLLLFVNDYNFEQETVEALIQYAYLGELPIDLNLFSTRCLSLYKLATEIKDDKLRNRCRHLVANRLSYTFLLELWIFAASHKDRVMLDYCAAYILNHLKAVPEAFFGVNDYNELIASGRADGASALVKAACGELLKREPVEESSEDEAPPKKTSWCNIL